MTASPIVFVDTETDSLAPTRKAWEVALIRRNPHTGLDDELHFFVRINLKDSDPFALSVGGFYDRHPQGRALSRFEIGSVGKPCEPQGRLLTTTEAAQRIASWTHGAHLVGCVPSFDAFTFDRMMRAEGILPGWSHHLIDVQTLAVGWLAAQGRKIPIPWRSDDLAAACGVPPLSPDDRHTALGDARWARDWFDVVSRPALTADKAGAAS